MRVAINDTTLTAIANAVREKKVTDRQYKPSELPEAILTIAGDSFDVAGFVSGDITTLNIPGSAKKIRVGAFNDQDSLFNVNKIVIGDGVTEIEDTVFASDTELGAFSYMGFNANGGQEHCSLKLSSTLENIGDNAFHSTGVSGTVVIPLSVKRVGRNAFYNTYITTLYIEGTPETIESNAFRFRNIHNGEVGENAGYITQYIHVPWKEGEGPEITGLNSYTEIVYNSQYYG